MGSKKTLIASTIERNGAPPHLRTVLIAAPDNLARIPTVKHWQLNGWYETSNPYFNNLTPRQYLKGKSWEERFRVGLQGLRDVGVSQ